MRTSRFDCLQMVASEGGQVGARNVVLSIFQLERLIHNAIDLGEKSAARECVYLCDAEESVARQNIRVPDDETVTGWINKAQGRYAGTLHQTRWLLMKYAEWIATLNQPNTRQPGASNQHLVSGADSKHNDEK